VARRLSKCGRVLVLPHSIDSRQGKVPVLVALGVRFRGLEPFGVPQPRQEHFLRDTDVAHPVRDIMSSHEPLVAVESMPSTGVERRLHPLRLHAPGQLGGLSADPQPGDGTEHGICSASRRRQSIDLGRGMTVAVGVFRVCKLTTVDEVAKVVPTPVSGSMTSLLVDAQHMLYCQRGSMRASASPLTVTRFESPNGTWQYHPIHPIR